jgi:flagellar basal-body rod protein FlgC
MNLFGVMDVSGSALQAERIRAEVVAANMANADTTRTAQGGPYRAQHVVFTSEAPVFGSEVATQMAGPMTGPMTGQVMGPMMGPMGAASFPGESRFEDTEPEIGGVRVTAVVQDQNAPLKRYDPGSPDADQQGYVSYPDINPITEMVDLMGATRAYGLNSSAVQAEKGMISSALDILK